MNLIIMRLALELRDMIFQIQSLVHGVCETPRVRIFDSDLHDVLKLRRTFRYSFGSEVATCSIGVCLRQDAKIGVACVASFIHDPREPLHDCFAVFPHRLQNYLGFPVENTRSMTGDDEYHAIRRIFLSFAFHETRHQLCLRNPDIRLRNLDEIFSDPRFPFVKSEQYMRDVMDARKFLLSLLPYSEKFFSLEQRKKMEEDAFIAEAIGFHSYPLYRDGRLSELAVVLRQFVLQ